MNKKEKDIAAGRFKADWNYKNVNESISDTCYKILFILWKCRFSFEQCYAYFIKTVVCMNVVEEVPCGYKMTWR